MLEFIIAFLLSLGYNLEDKSNLPDMDSKTMDLIRSDASYESLGGDKEFQTLYDNSDGTSIPEDNIVIGIDPNPPKD